MTTYIIEKVDYLDDDLKTYLKKELPVLCEKFNNKYDYNYAAIIRMIQSGVFLVCKRNDEITGIHISWLVQSPLDVRIKLLQQQLFYVKEGSGRSAYHLFKKFIDYGKKHADYIITMIGEHTNVKASTLKRWGFHESEILYQMKVENESRKSN